MVEPTLVLPPPRRPWWRLASLIAGLTVLGCCVAGVTALVVSSALRGDAGGAGPGGGSPAAATVPADTTPTGPGLGDPVRDGQFEFVVTALTCGHAELVNGILQARAQGQFCVLELSVTNIGAEPRHFADGLQRAYGPDGDQYAADTRAGVVANGNDAAVWNVINPGNAVQAKIVFDIPATATITAVQLHDSALSGGVRIAIAG